jgi:hypothetical protein
MKKVFMVLAAALIALPILAAPKPTPTPAANRKKVLDGKTSRMRVPPTVTPTPAADRKSQTIYQGGRGGAPATVTLTAGPVEGKPQKPAADERKYQTISNASRRSGKTTPSPTVGPLGSINLNSSRSNTYRQAQSTPTVTPAPVEGKPQKQQQRYVRETDPPTVPVERGATNSSRSTRVVVQPTVTPKRK